MAGQFDVTLTRRRLSPLLCGLALLGLAGCVDAEKPGLSLAARQSLKLTAVSVDFSPEAVLYIYPVEREVQASGSYDPEALRAAEKAQISRVLPGEFMAVVGPSLNGTRPVKARIIVSYFQVPGPMQAVIGSSALGMGGGVELVDAKSGEVLVTIPPGKISQAVARPGGVIGLAVHAMESSESSDVKTRQVSRNFAAEFANWLMSPN